MNKANPLTKFIVILIISTLFMSSAITKGETESPMGLIKGGGIEYTAKIITKVKDGYYEYDKGENTFHLVEGDIFYFKRGYLLFPFNINKPIKLTFTLEEGKNKNKSSEGNNTNEKKDAPQILEITGVIGEVKIEGNLISNAYTKLHSNTN